MQLLLDTHVFLWWQKGLIKQGSIFYEAISSPANEIIVSVATVWEIAIKRNAEKLIFSQDTKTAIEKNGFELLLIDAEHAERAAALPLHHRDPFDRMLIGQALEEGMVFATVDAKLKPYNVPQLRDE